MKTTNENYIIIVSDFKEGYAVAKKEINQKLLYGFVNEELSEVIPFIYDDASSFKNGKAYVEKGDEFFFIDKYNNIIEKDKPKRLSLINNCKGENR